MIIVCKSVLSLAQPCPGKSAASKPLKRFRMFSISNLLGHKHVVVVSPKHNNCQPYSHVGWSVFRFNDVWLWAGIRNSTLLRERLAGAPSCWNVKSSSDSFRLHGSNPLFTVTQKLFSERMPRPETNGRENANLQHTHWHLICHACLTSAVADHLCYVKRR